MYFQRDALNPGRNRQSVTSDARNLQFSRVTIFPSHGKLLSLTTKSFAEWLASAIRGQVVQRRTSPLRGSVQ